MFSTSARPTDVGHERFLSGASLLPPATRNGLSGRHTKSPAELRTRRAPHLRSRALPETGCYAVTNATPFGSHAIRAKFGLATDISVQAPGYLAACLSNARPLKRTVLCAGNAGPLTHTSINISAASITSNGLGNFNEGDRYVSGI